jgi:penicillin-binding protein 1C
MRRWALLGIVTRTAIGAFFCVVTIFISVFVLLMVSLRLVPFDEKTLFPGGLGTLVETRDGQPLRAYLARDDQWRLPITVDRVSPALVHATVAVEDQRFFRHRGVDWVAVMRAASRNFTGQGRRSGASTLTMQVVGLEDLPPRTVLRKLRQAFRAMQLELRRDKDHILSLYLTHAPYGGNVKGVEAAARKWLGKTPRDLSIAEAALLAGLPQSPSRFRPDRFPARARQRQAVVLRRMWEEGYITPKEYQEALRQPLAIGKATEGQGAFVRGQRLVGWHFSWMIRQLVPEGGIIRTTLDGDLQELAEDWLKRAVDERRVRGVTNGAVVVMEVGKGAVRALVGSANPGDRRGGGQINGATTPRPAGSTLKPLLYARAADLGQLLFPVERLPDVPTVFSGYRPQNSDRAFRGLVRADESLAWSLNLPALEVLRRLGAGEARTWLREDLGFKTLRASGDPYGLSLAVGTGQVRLLDLVAASRALASGGIFVEPRLVEEVSGEIREQGLGRRVFEKGTAEAVSWSLARTDLRPPEEVTAAAFGLEGVAWKTGTSNGQRDAWTVAWDRRWVVGVWMGNFDNKPSTALTGYEAAAPLALELMRELQRRGGDPAQSRLINPERLEDSRSTATAGSDGALEQVTICEETGREANSDCPTTRSLRTWQGARPVCRVHRRALLDEDTGTLLCTRCSDGREAREVVRAFHSGPVAAWIRRQTQEGQAAAVPLPEAHFELCPSQPPEAGPVILHPREGDTYFMDPLRPLSAQKLQPQLAGPVAGALWFLNEEFLEPGNPSGQDEREGPRIELRPGRHRLRVVTPTGASSEVRFQVYSAEDVLE